MNKEMPFLLILLSESVLQIFFETETGNANRIGAQFLRNLKEMNI
jgi:hypothetical protein